MVSPRVGKTALVDETGSRVKVKSPNLRRALVDTGLTLDDLRPKKASELQKLERTPLPPPALKRRAKAVEEMRRQHFREVMLAHEKYKAAELAGQLAAKMRDTPAPVSVEAAVRANKLAMAEQLERDKERMKRAEAMAQAEAQAAAKAARHADELMRELERSKAAAEQATRAKRNQLFQERLQREARRKAEEEAARELTHMQQAELEQYEERWSESFSQRQRTVSDRQHASNRAHLQRVAERKARERAREEQLAQRQLELEAKNEAHLNAHVCPSTLTVALSRSPSHTDLLFGSLGCPRGALPRANRQGQDTTGRGSRAEAPKGNGGATAVSARSDSAGRGADCGVQGASCGCRGGTGGSRGGR